jgi:hypothetical protein
MLNYFREEFLKERLVSKRYEIIQKKMRFRSEPFFYHVCFTVLLPASGTSLPTSPQKSAQDPCANPGNNNILMIGGYDIIL